MARKRYGGFSDPEIEAVDEVATEIEEAAEPATFNEEQVVEENVQEVQLTVTPETANLPYKITITINALNVRTGPGSTYQSIRIIKKGSVHKVLEEHDGWGRIGENAWINLSNKFVQKV